jgi:hypothetical protein
MDKRPHVVFPNDPHHTLTRYIQIPDSMARYDETTFIREVFPPALFDSADPLEITQHVILADQLCCGQAQSYYHRYDANGPRV